ncbi:MAG: hypothetical protein PHZ27_01675, partial [Candidatus Omnitrophica bacterium]|nr:hypothetical protein [Candidatus Omnitrophota bacterium]
MNNKRKVIRLECGDFLDMRLSDKGEKIRGEVRDFSLMGICFSSNKNWVKGQDIYIDYFMRDELDAVRMR